MVSTAGTCRFSRYVPIKRCRWCPGNLTRKGAPHKERLPGGGGDGLLQILVWPAVRFLVQPLLIAIPPIAIGRVETFLPDGLLLPIVETPKGGRHYYFAHSPSLKNWVGAFPGVDIRTTGGQVLLPPSAKGDRIYRWLNGLAIHQVERPPMPQKLVSAILHATKKEDPIYKSKRVDPGAYGAAALAAELATLAQAVKGERNANLNRAAYSLGQLVAGGEIDAGQVEGGLMAMAISIGLSQSESMRTIKSGMASGAAKPRKSKKDFEKRQRNPQSATPRFKKKIRQSSAYRTCIAWS